VTGAGPQVEIALSTEGGLLLDVLVDFGAGCTSDHSGEMCSGSASGAISQAAQTIDLAFNNLACNENSLNGTVAAAFDITETQVSLAGNWMLDGVKDGDAFAADGNGTAVYDRAGHFTTIQNFSGSLGRNESSWTCTMTGIVVSYQNNANLIPSAGTIELSGTGIPNLTLQFDANSPITGEFLVSVDGGPFEPTNAQRD
jgi:hypothetical protein